MAQDIFEYLFTLLTSFPYNVILLVAVIGYIIYIFIGKRRKEDDTFQIEDFRDSVYMETEKLMKTFGIPIDAKLMRGIEPLGSISKFYHFIGKTQYDNPDKEGEIIISDINVWIFQLGKESIFSKIFGSYKDFVIIDNEQLETYDGHRKTFSIKEEVSLRPYAKVFISSVNAMHYINEISYKRCQEEILTHAQNFPRKVAYLELKQAKTMERYEASLEQKRSGFEKYKRDVLASGKDIEDDED